MCPNPQDWPLRHLPRSNRLYGCNEIKELKMGRFSWINQADPVSHRAIRGRQRVGISEDVVMEAEARENERKI